MNPTIKKGTRVYVVVDSRGLGEPFVSRETVHAIRLNGRVSFMGGAGCTADPADVFLDSDSAYRRLATRLQLYAQDLNVRAVEARQHSATILSELSKNSA